MRRKAHMAIQIPDPVPSDSDKVVQLLQSAALFGRIGDAEEALHFLRQAAECAGDNGDDARTLALARSAAELSGSLEPGSEPGKNGKSGVHARRLPEPPPRSLPPASSRSTSPLPNAKLDGAAHAAGAADAAGAETDAEDEPVLLLKRTAPHSKPPAQPSGSTAPRDMSAEDRAPESRSMLAPPPLPSVRANGSRAPTLSTRPAPTPSRPGLASRPAPTLSRPASASRPAPPSMRASAPAPVASRLPSLSGRLPAAARSSTPPATAKTLAPPAPTQEVVSAHPSLRQAARVSVERSASDPGLLLVRVLEEGKAPEPGCTEALLVSLDAGARPFTG